VCPVRREPLGGGGRGASEPQAGAEGLAADQLAQLVGGSRGPVFRQPEEE